MTRCYNCFEKDDSLYFDRRTGKCITKATCTYLNKEQKICEEGIGQYCPKIQASDIETQYDCVEKCEEGYIS